MKLQNKKIITLLFGMVCMVSVSLSGCGSNGEETGKNPSTETVVQGTEVQGAEDAPMTIVGEGVHQFLFTVVDKDGNETNFEVHTDKEIVGDALLEYDLIAGDESEYGLYVKSVNGITADYDVDQTYWAFYVNGEYATAGVDTTPIEDGMTYTFQVEK